jgi:hypothetical protein
MLFRVVGSVFIYEGRVCVLQTGVHFLQYSEYWVMRSNVCVTHVEVIFTDLYFSNLFKCFPFLCILIMSIVSVMIPYLVCGLSILNYYYYYF